MPPTVSLHLPSPPPEAGGLPAAEAFARVLGEAGAAGGELHLILTDAGELRRLNREFREKDRATDVVAFDYRAAGDGLGEGDLWGDVYVSVEAARAQALERKIPLREELARLFLHGCLHLMGLCDGTPAERSRMEAVQERLVAKLIPEMSPKSVGVPRPGRPSRAEGSARGTAAPLAKTPSTNRAGSARGTAAPPAPTKK